MRHALSAALLACASSWTPPMRKRTPIAPRHALKVEQDARWPGWTESVDPAAKLLYMPFLDKQLQILDKIGAIERPEEVRPDLRLGERPRRSDDDAKGAARVGSRVFEVPGRFRRVRMTYFDGGQSLQVFNSLWYPTFNRPDAPLLGVDDAEELLGSESQQVDAEQRRVRPVERRVPQRIEDLEGLAAVEVGHAHPPECPGHLKNSTPDACGALRVVIGSSRSLT